MRRLNRGQELTAEELREVAENLIVSIHAEQRVAERFPNLNISKAILKPTIAFFNTDGTIYIGLNGYEHLVIDIKPYGYKLVTIKQRSFTDVTVFDKQEMAKAGHIDKYRTEKTNKYNKNFQKNFKNPIDNAKFMSII